MTREPEERPEPTLPTVVDGAEGLAVRAGHARGHELRPSLRPPRGATGAWGG